MTKKLLYFIIMLMPLSMTAQNTALFLEFHPKVGGNDYVLETTVQDLSGNYFSVDDFNYYISNIHVIHDGGQDLDLSDTVLIVKGDAFGLFLGHYNLTSVEQINFGVGVPQAINHLDISQYPAGHPLSFHTPSMHWGWTAGYKFLLCDGMGDSNGDGTPETIFQLHDLGDANYKNVQLPITATDYGTHQTIVVNCNMDEWIYGANPATVGIMHGETGINASTMNNVVIRNVFTAPTNVGISELEERGELYFVNNTNTVKVIWKDLTGLHRVSITDMRGATITESFISNVTDEMIIELSAGGQYIFTAYDENNTIINTVKIVH